MSDTVYRSIAELKGFSAKNCLPMPEPVRALMCQPDYYEARDERSPFAAGRQGRINPQLAREQWLGLRGALAAAGLEVSCIPPLPGLSEMVFCSNQAFVGLTPKLERVCLLSSMRYSSRRREVAAFEKWFREAGYHVAALKDTGAIFEGAGDAVWHPGKRLIWGGCGFFTDAGIYEELARVFASPVVLLKLVNERFSHLDACFCPLTQEAVLIYPAAFDAASLELIFRLFPVIITASEHEAMRQMACNAAVIGGKTVLLQSGTVNAARHLGALGLEVVTADVSEFIKGGGGPRALRMPVY